MSELKISKTVFCKEALLKTVYLWQEDFKRTITDDDNNFILKIEPRNENTRFNNDSFNRQLQEQQLREYLNSQFGNLREYIYKMAFTSFKD